MQFSLKVILEFLPCLPLMMEQWHAQRLGAWFLELQKVDLHLQFTALKIPCLSPANPLPSPALDNHSFYCLHNKVRQFSYCLHIVFYLF